MTLITGLKSHDSIFITGDCLISYGDVPENSDQDSITSFGENRDLSGTYVNDNMLKVNVYENKLVVAYAGTVSYCTDFIKDLFRKIRLYNSTDTVKLINDTLAEYNYQSKMSFIFGFIYNDRPTLLPYNNNDSCNCALEEISEFTWAGSLPTETIMILKQYNILLMKKKALWTPDQLMVANCAIQQNLIMRHNHVADGVGGLITGAYINNTGSYWLKDTTYLIYNNEDLTNLEFDANISVALRENGAVIQTPQTGASNKIIVNTYSEDPIKEGNEWCSKYYNEAIDKTNASDSEFQVFINSKKAVVGILSVNCKQYINSVSKSKLRQDFAYSSEWLNKLLTYIEPNEQGEYPISTYYCWE